MTTPTPTLPEALRLAEDLIQVHNGHADEGPSSFSEAAAELRRLHAQVEALSIAQAELAAMRATGEPVAEMVPYHTPSGKRVAVISRFQHLPIGTKLYTHPQPAPTPQADSQPAPLREGEWINDAGRIKWLLWRVQDLEAKLAARAPADSVLVRFPVKDEI